MRERLFWREEHKLVLHGTINMTVIYKFRLITTSPVYHISQHILERFIPRAPQQLAHYYDFRMTNYTFYPGTFNDLLKKG